jgi:hypothetical protein
VSASSLPKEQILTLLSTQSAQISELAVGLTEVQLHKPPHPGEWSAIEVLAHLRSCADVWGNCMLTILNENNPTIRAINPRTWINSTNYLELDFWPSLRAFTTQRDGLLEVLKPLKPKDWSRSAIITGAGKPLERTVHYYAEWLATHERPHVKQLVRIASTVNQ